MPTLFMSHAETQRPANDALELTRGPFAGTGETNCTASRWLHFAPSEALVSRGSQRAAGRPARGARAQLSDGRWADPHDRPVSQIHDVVRNAETAPLVR